VLDSLVVLLKALHHNRILHNDKITKYSLQLIQTDIKQIQMANSHHLEKLKTHNISATD